jgi:hypothetical protein
MTTRQRVVAIAGRSIARARIAGKGAAKRLVAAADAELVKQGKAARARQRKRAVKAALKKVMKTIAIAGTAAATVLAARVTSRAVRRRAEARRP